jgi:hypothetical protein
LPEYDRSHLKKRPGLFQIEDLDRSEGALRTKAAVVDAAGLASRHPDNCRLRAGGPHFIGQQGHLTTLDIIDLDGNWAGLSETKSDGG